MDPACGTGGFLVYAMRHSINILSKKFDDGLISKRHFDSGKQRLMCSFQDYLARCFRAMWVLVHIW